MSALDTKVKANIGLNVGTLVALLIALVGGIFIATDMYGIVKKVETQSKANGDAVNQTLHQLLNVQEDNNVRGNTTLFLIQTLLQKMDNNSNATFANQELFFKPYLNDSFNKIYRALNITN
jgi:hypothetical protein